MDKGPWKGWNGATVRRLLALDAGTVDRLYEEVAGLDGPAAQDLRR